MKRFNRYLMFYMILGIGLAIAWTQVGRRMQLAPNVGMKVMSIDDRCEPETAPCAAYAENFALVLGPNDGRGGLLLVGERLPGEARLDVMQLDIHSTQLPAPLVRSMAGSRWLVEPRREPGRLRVNLSAGDTQWVAEFPLQ